MRIILTKEERERLIELLVSEKSNLLPLDRKDCNYLKDAQTIIEYTFRTNLMRDDEDRVTELLKIVSEADLSDMKGFHHLYVIIRTALTHEITMNEMSDIFKVLEKMCDDEASLLWTVTHENNLNSNLELVIVASK